MTNDTHHAVVCTTCNTRFGLHKGGTDDYGVKDTCPIKAEEPMYPHTVKDRDKASALYARRLAKHWAADTTFKART